MAEKPLIGFIGQGFIGKNYADDFERRGYETVRYALEEPYVKNKDRIKDCDFVFIAVPTPTVPNGTSNTGAPRSKFDASIVESAIGLVGKGKVAVVKSTIVPGTTKKFQEKYPDKIVIYSPEFLSEATAAHDAGHPFSNVVGLTKNSSEYKAVAEKLHAVLPPAPFSLTCTSTEAEIIKYTHNGSGYTQIVFFNLMYDLAQAHGCNWELIQHAIKADPLIANRYANPIHKSGRGAGGHCFIKDVAALAAEYDARVDDEKGKTFFAAMQEKNIELLRSTGKDLDLLAGVYGAAVVEGVVARKEPARIHAVRGSVRVLVCTEALDRADALLGFFHRWVEEIGRHAWRVHVICLGKGDHSLPVNVSEHSLGKESAQGLHLVKRARYALRFLTYVWRLRNEYDTVLVHLSPEYVLLGGLFWKISGKRVGFWYNETSANWLTRMAIPLCNVMFYSNPNSYVARFAHARQIPMGVDTDMYSMARTESNTLLSLGRITAKKNLDVVLAAVADVAKKHPGLTLDVYGKAHPGDEQYAAGLRSRFAELERAGIVHHRGAVLHEKTPDIYASHGIFIHAGSHQASNKTLLEAAASGALVITAEKTFEWHVDKRLFLKSVTKENIARAITAALAFTPEEREAERAKLRAYVRREHALSSVVPAMLEMLRRKGGEKVTG